MRIRNTEFDNRAVAGVGCAAAVLCIGLVAFRRRATLAPWALTDRNIAPLSLENWLSELDGALQQATWEDKNILGILGMRRAQYQTDELIVRFLHCATSEGKEFSEIGQWKQWFKKFAQANPQHPLVKEIDQCKRFWIRLEDLMDDAERIHIPQYAALREALSPAGERVRCLMEQRDFVALAGGKGWPDAIKWIQESERRGWLFDSELLSAPLGGKQKFETWLAQINCEEISSIPSLPLDAQRYFETWLSEVDHLARNITWEDERISNLLLGMESNMQQDQLASLLMKTAQAEGKEWTHSWQLIEWGEVFVQDNPGHELAPLMATRDSDLWLHIDNLIEGRRAPVDPARYAALTEALTPSGQRLHDLTRWKLSLYEDCPNGYWQLLYLIYGMPNAKIDSALADWFRLLPVKWPYGFRRMM